MEEIVDELLAKDLEIQSLKDLVKDMAEDYRILQMDLDEMEDKYHLTQGEVSDLYKKLEDIRDIIGI